MAQDRAVKGEGLYRGVAGERNTRSVALLGRIDVFSRRQHSRERSQRQIELLGAGGAERQADGVGSMAGDHGEGGLCFFNDTATTEIYTLSLHDALPISPGWAGTWSRAPTCITRWCSPGATST